MKIECYETNIYMKAECLQTNAASFCGGKGKE
jgi:hypothetical protein